MRPTLASLVLAIAMMPMAGCDTGGAIPYQPPGPPLDPVAENAKSIRAMIERLQSDQELEALQANLTGVVENLRDIPGRLEGAHKPVFEELLKGCQELQTLCGTKPAKADVAKKIEELVSTAKKLPD